MPAKPTEGYIFIRHGHHQPIDRTRAAINQAYELGLLGQNILGTDFSFDVEVALTGDSYVSGEETALMEAIEGKRSMPRFRPPFPAQVGVFGMPSNINNVQKRWPMCRRLSPTAASGSPASAPRPTRITASTAAAAPPYCAYPATLPTRG